MDADKTFEEIRSLISQGRNDEAVKLSQELSNDVSFRFINGILDAYRKDVEGHHDHA